MAGLLMNAVRVTASRASNSIVERATNAAVQVGLDKLKSKIPASARKHLPLARKLLSGDIMGAVDGALDNVFEKFGIRGTLLPGGAGAGATPLLGGITMQKAKEIFEQSIGTDYAKKNLWCLRVRNLQGGETLDINLFATDVSYSGFTVVGDAVHVGSGSFDVVTNSERREMRVVTMDDSAGSVKRWFADRHDRMCHADGTFGLPIEYLFRVDVLHAFINEEVDGAPQAWVDTYIMRPGNLDLDLSRREDGLQELSMTLVQWDTFAALS